MPTKYPILLIHGVAVKNIGVVKAFGKLGTALAEAGNTVFCPDTDGFGSIETNAAMLREGILDVLAKTGAEKVNLFAHSKGGLDAKYLLMHDEEIRAHVASLTTLSTPHRGAGAATLLYGLWRPIRAIVAFFVNVWYRIFGDRHPDALTVCRQLRLSPNEELDSLTMPEGVYCRSYSATMHRKRDDFLMSIPLAFTRRCDKRPSDGLVAAESAKFGTYLGDCIDGSLSHSEMIGYSLKKKKREQVKRFYLALAEELAELGY